MPSDGTFRWPGTVCRACGFNWEEHSMFAPFVIPGVCDGFEEEDDKEKESLYGA